MVSKLRKIGGAKRKNVLLESTKIGVLTGEILSRAELMIERDEANYLLAEADEMMKTCCAKWGIRKGNYLKHTNSSQRSIHMRVVKWMN